MRPIGFTLRGRTRPSAPPPHTQSGSADTELRGRGGGRGGDAPLCRWDPSTRGCVQVPAEPPPPPPRRPSPLEAAPPASIPPPSPAKAPLTAPHRPRCCALKAHRFGFRGSERGRRGVTIPGGWVCDAELIPRWSPAWSQWQKFPAGRTSPLLSPPPAFGAPIPHQNPPLPHASLYHEGSEASPPPSPSNPRDPPPQHHVPIYPIPAPHSHVHPHPWGAVQRHAHTSSHACAHTAGDPRAGGLRGGASQLCAPCGAARAAMLNRWSLFALAPHIPALHAAPVEPHPCPGMGSTGGFGEGGRGGLGRFWGEESTDTAAAVGGIFIFPPSRRWRETAQWNMWEP